MKETIIIEIDGAAGGEEGKIFANDLYNMYTKYAASLFKIKELNKEPIIFSITGEDVFNIFKWEAGVHRVQRVPKTEKKGRVHTSTVTISVVKQENYKQISIRPEDLEITSCRSSGAGGQHVNKTNSKIRILHKPTGIVVECQEERSQIQNKNKAIEKLTQMLQSNANSIIDKNKSNTRKEQIGSGSRNEKIRTYNFKDNRLTDHRINYNVNKLNKIMSGDLDSLFTALKVLELEN